MLAGVFQKVSKLEVAFFECSAERPLYGMHRVDDDWEWTIGFPQISAILKWRPQSTLSETAM